LHRDTDLRAGHTLRLPESRKEQLLSFFDEGGGEEPSQANRVPRPPRPRRTAGGLPDHQTLVVRRAIGLGGALVLLVLLVLGVNGCVNSQKLDALKSYSHSVGQIAQDSDQSVARPLFSDLSGANGKSPLDVSVQINQLKLRAQAEAKQARGLDVPGDLAGAQRNLLLSLDLRGEALQHVADQVTSALGGQSAGDAVARIAGEMEALLASDVIYSQRVVPLVAQALDDNGVHGQGPGSSRFLLDLGWLTPSYVSGQLSGQGASAASAPAAPGSHGHSVAGVSVGSNQLASTGINHASGGASPTLSVMVANQGSNNETGVKVDVSVTGAGKTTKTVKTVDRTQAGASATVDIPLSGVPTGVTSRLTVFIEPVPGEKNIANNKATYSVVFGP